MSAFRRHIRPHVEMELTSADACAKRRDFAESFRHLERAHVLAQMSTFEHVRVHWRMLLWAFRQNDRHEVRGQIFRILGAATKTAIGLVPHGNTGGSNVSPLARMPVPDDLKTLIALARGST